MNSGFGHPPGLVAWWRRLASRALAAGARTPFYLFSAEPFTGRIAELESLDLGRPATLWLSCKTQPLAPLLRWWAAQGRPIEVVSEFEFRGAIAEGFPPERILVNGPAKHRWLPGVSVRGIRVNFDSPAELAALLPLARRHHWRTGLRLRTAGETDPEFPDSPTQFGFERDEVSAALRRLGKAGLKPETLHFHLRTNVPDPGFFDRALSEVAELCGQIGWRPQNLDTGGGLPPRYTLDRQGDRMDGGYPGGLDTYAATLRQAAAWFPGLREWWLEHGRFVSAGSGVLVVTVLDARSRSGIRQLLCDGGRTLNALISIWEQHALVPLPTRRGKGVTTVVHGPTCMAFDQLSRRPLPSSVRPGDQLLWMDAGAYHLSWETRFSHGLAEVWWHDGRGLERTRTAEGFADYWTRSGGTPRPAVLP